VAALGSRRTRLADGPDRTEHGIYPPPGGFRQRTNDALPHPFVVCGRQLGKLAVNDGSSSGGKLGDFHFTPDHLKVQGLAVAVWAEINVEVGSVAKNVDVDQLGVRGCLERSTDLGQHRANLAGLLAIEIRDVRNVTLGAEIGESSDFASETRREAP
jgi:hypothetical protein